MARRRSRVEAARSDATEALSRLAPLALDAATVARAGIARAALDAVAARPLVTASREAARASRRLDRLTAHFNAVGSLASRSAAAAATTVAAAPVPAPERA